jgi:hypothetical protein
MATVQVGIVNRALRLIHQLAAGGSPSTDESNAALTACNAMLDAWNLDRSLVYCLREESLTLSNATASYTVGSSGSPTLNTTRPVEIRRAWIVDGDNSYEVTEMTEEEYAALIDKTQAGDWPDKFLHRASYPNATVIVHPVPNATRTMKLMTRTPLAAMALSDTLAAPPGWERGIAFNLAVELAPEYETTASPKVEQIASNALAAIRRQNIPPARASSDLMKVLGGGYGNILTG